MKFLHYGKDGGPESTVNGFWLIEIKSLFSVALLRFSKGSRDSYHTHAFNGLSWVLKGKLREHLLLGTDKTKRRPSISFHTYRPSLEPIITYRDTFHKVISEDVSWVFTIRGPWSKTWHEFIPNTSKITTLTNGRKEVTV